MIKKDWRFSCVSALFLMALADFCFKLSAQGRTSLEGAVVILVIQTLVVFIGLIFKRGKISIQFVKIGGWELTAGVCGGISVALFYTAMREGPVSIVIPIITLSYILTVGLGVLFLKEKIGLRKVLGLICGIAAVILLIYS